MGRSLPSWEVPFAAESLPREHLTLLMAVGSGMTDRVRFLEYFEEHADEHREGTYLLGLAHLQCGMPFGALLILSRLVEERPEHVPVRADLATALVHAGRPGTARTVLARAAGILAERGDGLSTRWLRRIERRVAWVDRALELHALERKFLVLRAAAWAEATATAPPEAAVPSETLLLHARTLCALGELDDAIPPFWEAAKIMTRVMAAAPGRISALEMFVRIARSSLPAPLRRDALAALRAEDPGSPALREARAATLEERVLRRREAESEWYVISDDIAHGDEETLHRALDRIQRRAMCGDYRSPFLASWISYNAHTEELDAVRELSDEVAREPDMDPLDLCSVAESLARSGLRDEALGHARRCAGQTDDPEAAARAAALMEALDGTAR
ncbi:hypothetical protein [Streptomyces sp. NPDC087300]|uniref:hypothetical protein n=1 Tax=Streptomyces sp. NPDC087300 TaxID=3365780 RepID=UPI0037FA8D1B